MKKIILFLFCLLIIQKNLFAQPTIKNYWSSPNGPVNVIHEDKANNTLYIGGDFNYVGSYIGELGLVETPNGSYVDTVSGKSLGINSKTNGRILCEIPDGNGGKFIGGAFTQVDGLTRNRLAHIDSEGKLFPWNPGANGNINTMYLVGNTLYIGGSFTVVNEKTRINLAAVDVNTGIVNEWTPYTDNAVGGIFVKGNSVYISGTFTTVRDQARKYLASVDLSTGTLLPWNPNPNGSISKCFIHNTKIYVTGRFTQLNGLDCKYIATIDTLNGVPDTNWKPNPNGNIDAAFVSDNIIYIGGSFTNIFNLDRNRLASINLINGNITPWNPDANNRVSSITVLGNKVYVSGDFDSINGNKTIKIAAIHKDSYQLDSTWKPNPNGTIIRVTENGNSIHISGYFTHIGGHYRNRLAAINTKTGQVTSWDPNISDAEYGQAISAISVSGNKVYIGGGFYQVGKHLRNRIAAVDIKSGEVDSLWHPKITQLKSQIFDMAFVNDKVYLGGEFDSIGGLRRNGLAAVDITSGNVDLNWNPNPNINVGAPKIKAIKFYNNQLFVGGEFSSIGGSLRNNIASLNLINGGSNIWQTNRNASQIVSTINISGNVVYAGPTDLSMYNIETGQLISSISTKTTSFNVFNEIVYTGNQVNESFNLSSSSWGPISCDGRILTIIANDSSLFVGGQFKNFNDGSSSKYLTVFDLYKTNTGIQNTTYPKSKMLVYPNPAKETMIVDVGNIQVIGDIEVFNILGEEFNNITIVKEENRFIINTSNLPNNLYYVIFKTSSFRYITKIIIKN